MTFRVPSNPKHSVTHDWHPEGSHLVPPPHARLPHGTGLPLTCSASTTKTCLALSEASCYTQGLEEPRNRPGKWRSKQKCCPQPCEIRSPLLFSIRPTFSPVALSAPVSAEAFSTVLPLSGFQEESQTHQTPNILSCVANGKVKKPLLLLEDFTTVSFPQIPIL